MYIRPRKERKSSPIRVLILLILIAAGLYLIIERPAWIQTPFMPTPTPTTTAESHLEEGWNFYLDGQLEQAILAYEKAAVVRPDDDSIYVRWARLLALRGRTAQAVQRAERAVDLDPEKAANQAILCMALDWHAGNVKEDEGSELLKKALDACQRALLLDSNYAEGHAYLAEVYADFGSWGRALEEAELAVQLDDGSVDAHRNLGYVLERQGKYRQAVEEYQIAIELHPRLAHLYIGAGRNYLILEDYRLAVSHFQTATEVDPDNPAGHDMLGWAYFAQGDYALATAQFEKAIELNPDYAQAYGHLGLAYYVRRHYEMAITTLQKALDMGHERVEYYYEIGLSYIFLDQCDQAIPWLEKALELDPTSRPAYEGLVLCGQRPPWPTDTPTVEVPEE
jgi:tetratricopeptide (TPR) repeat protein